MEMQPALNQIGCMGWEFKSKFSGYNHEQSIKGCMSELMLFALSCRPVGKLHKWDKDGGIVLHHRYWSGCISPLLQTYL